MGSEKQNTSEMYSHHTMVESEPPVSPISIPKIRETRDMVYSGTINTPIIETSTANGAQLPRNKKPRQWKISPFTMVLILLGTAVASVLYIGNILAVGRLMIQINRLQTKHQQILNEQELLKAQMNRMSGLERIQKLAHDQLGLQNPKQLPVWIEIDPERVNQVEEEIQQMERRR
jgi:cell division protein FtsL